MRTRAASLVVVALVALAGAQAATARTSPARMREVVREWSRFVNSHDNAALAGLFRLPVIVEQGGVGYRLKTKRHIALWHDGFPCSGKVTEIRIRGDVATVVFVLGNRASTGSTCDSPGELAAADFEFVDGKIVHWTQVPVPAGAKKPRPGQVA